jgi:hypothetical protein
MRDRWRRPSREVLQARARELRAALPPTLIADTRGAVLRLRKARSPRQLVGAFDAELISLFDGLAPAVIEHPLPMANPRTAATAVAVIAGCAAAVDEIEAIALLLPGVDVVATPSLPVVAGAYFSAFALEAYVAGSLRVHLLQAGGYSVDPATLTRDVLTAMTGRTETTSPATNLTRAAANPLTRRMLRRWARGIVPFVGIGYASWDARRTIRTITRMPLAQTVRPIER